MLNVEAGAAMDCEPRMLLKTIVAATSPWVRNPQVTSDQRGLSGSRTPERRPPPIQHRLILRPVSLLNPGRLEIVVIADRTPPSFTWLILGWRTHVPAETLLARSERGEGPLCIDQRGLICAASPCRPAQLDDVIFPEADRAAFIRARRLAKRKVTTTGTRIRPLH